MWDDEAQAVRADSVVNGDETVLITDVVLVEAVWTLADSKYRLGKPDVVAAVGRLFGDRRLAERLEAADQQPARIVPDVETAVVVGQGRQVAFHAVDGAGEPVEVLASPMLAFLIGQVQQRGCTLFAKARVKTERPRYFWDKSLPPSPIGGAQAVPDLPRGGLGDVVAGDCVRIPGRDGAL